MTSTGGWGVPGSGALVETVEKEIIWGGDRAKGMVLEMSGNYSSAIVMVGETVTTDIKPGFLVGKLTTGGELIEWDASATNGSENIFGVVPLDFRTLDFNATAQDRVLPVIVRAPLKTAALLIKDLAGTGVEALDGGDFEYIARRQLHAMGCILDDDTQGLKAGAMARIIPKTAAHTITADENGMTFTNTGAAGSVTFTLPAAQYGLEYEFFADADFAIVVDGPANTLIVDDDRAATSISVATATEIVGTRFRAVANRLNTLWHIEVSLGLESTTLTIV